MRTQDVSKITETCQQHPQREITGYCNDCDVPCCMVCIEEKHPRHIIVAIDRKYMECEDRLNEMAKDLEKKTLKDLEENFENLQKELN